MVLGDTEISSMFVLVDRVGWDLSIWSMLYEMTHPITVC